MKSGVLLFGYSENPEVRVAFRVEFYCLGTLKTLK